MNYDFSHWPALPSVSCQCLTYGRPELLAEAVESFFRQDYPGPKELIILNDQAGVRLRLEHPEVRVVNLGRRVPTIGGKRNLCAAMSRGELLLPWDDDDIHLPWRISVTVAEMRNHHYFKPKRFWCLTPNKFKLERPGGGAPSMAGFSRDLWRRVGGYPLIQSGQDTEFQRRIRSQAPELWDCRYLPDDQVPYVYRWGTGHYHLSGYGRGQTGFDRIGNRIEGRAGGELVIQPTWRRDYVAETRAILATMPIKNVA